MAKKSKIALAHKRARLVAKYRERRKELKNIIKKGKDYDVIAEAQAKLAKLPRDANPVRYVTICQQCARPHAVYRKFGLCRICLRLHLMSGNVAGGRTSSW